jgi:hypothetical protein
MVLAWDLFITFRSTFMAPTGRATPSSIAVKFEGETADEGEIVERKPLRSLVTEPSRVSGEEVEGEEDISGEYVMSFL